MTSILWTIAAVAVVVLLAIAIDAYNRRKISLAILRTKMQHRENIKAGALRRLEVQTWQRKSR